MSTEQSPAQSPETDTSRKHDCQTAKAGGRGGRTRDRNYGGDGAGEPAQDSDILRVTGRFRYGGLRVRVRQTGPVQDSAMESQNYQNKSQVVKQNINKMNSTSMVSCCAWNRDSVGTLPGADVDRRWACLWTGSASLSFYRQDVMVQMENESLTGHQSWAQRTFSNL